jgi:hypothetical protein
MLVFRNGIVEILDRRALATLGEFDPAYLFPDDLRKD